LRIGVVIPALDEERAIGLVVGEVRALVAEVVVVDNGSRDRTPDVARAAGARVVAEPRRGYGQACLTGIAALGEGADVIVFLDGDYSDHPGQLPDVVAPILAGRADMVIGSRTLGRAAPGSHPWHAVLGTRFCVGLMNLAGSGTKVSTRVLRASMAASQLVFPSASTGTSSLRDLSSSAPSTLRSRKSSPEKPSSGP
jgi:glycosyltransferase involved in cell wall biosynthesis